MSGGQAIEDLQALMLYWICTLVSAWLAKLTRLSPLVFYLIFGMILANAKVTQHSEFLTSFSEVCITVVFFALGLEENVQHFKEGIRKAWGIASIGAIVPFVIGFGFTHIFWPGVDHKVALMGGLAVTATAVSLTMISLKAEGLASSKPAIGIMTSAVLDDIASLALVAVCVPIATGEAEPTAEGICWIMGKAALFFLCVFVAHFIVFPHDVETGIISRIPIVRRFGIHHLFRFASGEQAIMLSLLIAVFFGMVSHWWGFHPTIGAYMSGLILDERYYDLHDEDEGNVYQHTLHHIEEAAFGYLGPVFFVNLGTTFIIDTEILTSTIGYSFIFYVVLGVGQFLSAAFAAKYVPGGFSWADSAMIGFGMLGRAELFFVVLNICYIDNAILSKEQVFTFTITALLLDITVPVVIAVYKPYYSRAVEREAAASNNVSVVDWNVNDSEHNEVARRESWIGAVMLTRKKAHKSEIRKNRRILTVDPNGGIRSGSKDSCASGRPERILSGRQLQQQEVAASSSSPAPPITIKKRDEAPADASETTAEEFSPPGTVQDIIAKEV